MKTIIFMLLLTFSACSSKVSEETKQHQEDSKNEARGRK